MALVLAAAMLVSLGACQPPGPAPSSIEGESTPLEQLLPEPEAPPPEPDPQADPPSAAPPAPSPEERQRAGERLAPRIEELCREYEVMGMSLVVFDCRGPFYSQNWGWAVEETGRPVTEDTVFRVASISKAVTALLALDLAEQGKLDLHRDLTGALGVPVNNPHCPGAVITPWHLLTHTSGIVDSQVYWNAMEGKALPPLASVLPWSFSACAPGSCYSYSNLGMGLMAGVVEAAAGESLLDYTRREVFEPMGIDAAYSYTDIRRKEQVANIYDQGALAVNMPDWRNMNAKYAGLPLGQLYALGHGDLFITARDLSRFARIMAGCPREGEPVALSPEYLRLMQEVQYQEGEGPEAVMRGLGTQITDYLVEGRRMAGHQGNAYGSICGMFFDPEDHTGFVFLTNGARGGKDETGLYDINREVARAVYGAFFEEETVVQSVPEQGK